MPINGIHTGAMSTRFQRDDAVELACRVKAIRLNKQMSLEQLAQCAGLSRDMVVKIEEQYRVPSLRVLGKLAQGLDVSIAELVQGLYEQPKPAVVRHDQRRIEILADSGAEVRQEALASGPPHAGMRPFLLKISGGNVKHAVMPDQGQGFLIVTSGHIDFQYGNTHCELNEGDSVYFDGGIEHQLVNRSQKPAEVLCVVAKGQASSI